MQGQVEQAEARRRSAVTLVEKLWVIARGSASPGDPISLAQFSKTVAKRCASVYTIHIKTTLNAMGRGLGQKQQQMLGWLQQQWSMGIQPNRNELMDAFVVDTGTIWRWDKSMRRQIEEQLKALGFEQVAACIEATSRAKQHPDRPEQTPRPEAEGYRRALRTLIDRALVKVVADDQSFYRYCDPEADNPLQVTSYSGRYYKKIVEGRECGRRRSGSAVSPCQL